MNFQTKLVKISITSECDFETVKKFQKYASFYKRCCKRVYHSPKSCSESKNLLKTEKLLKRCEQNMSRPVRGRGRFSRCSSVQLMNNFWMHSAKKSPVVTSAHSRYSGKGGRMARVGFKGQVACSRKKIKSTT